MRNVILFLIFLTSFSSFQTHAKEYKGITLDDQTTVAGEKLVLNGMGLRKALGMFDVYVAGLYVAEKSSDENVILASQKPKKLIMHFKRFLDKGKLRTAWEDGFKRNAPKDYSYKSDLNKLLEAMVNMKEGERIQITFLSDKVELQLRDEPAVTIEGAAFSKTLLSVFIVNPPDSDLKEGLLGGH